jgi:hypothetical protein
MSRPDEERAAGEAEAAPTIDDLVLHGDVDALMELAKSYRASKDLKACLTCYEAAAKLGNPEAEHAVGLFYLSGGVAPKDEKKAASYFRSAADRGHLPSRVYVANLYELGVHYKADPEKADVWYRNAARSAKITHDPDSPDFTRAMAELGCVRYCLKMIDDPESNEDERVYYTKKARAYGWRPKASEPAPAPGSQSASESESESAPAKPRKTPTKKPAPDSKITFAAGMTAFLWASLLVGAAVGAGYLGLEGVRLIVAKYGPILGAHEERIVLGVAAGLGVLGAMMVYTFKSVAQALVAAALFAGLGWFTWRGPALHLFHLQTAQAIAFGIAGFLAALLVLGLVGGAKARTRTRTRTR